jgi:hypothetical protein
MLLKLYVLGRPGYPTASLLVTLRRSQRLFNYVVVRRGSWGFDVMRRRCLLPTPPVYMDNVFTLTGLAPSSRSP